MMTTECIWLTFLNDEELSVCGIKDRYIQHKTRVSALNCASCFYAHLESN